MYIESPQKAELKQCWIRSL